jgi:hypothetical protein
MKCKAAIAALFFFPFRSGIEQSVQAASLIKGIEKSLNRINRQLCANMPSSNCKKFKTKSRHRAKTSARPAAPVVAPRVAPVLPKPRPADLKTDIPAKTHKLSPIVPPPTMAKPKPPAVVIPVTPPVPPLPPAVAKPAPPVDVAPVTPPVPPPTVAKPASPPVVAPVAPPVAPLTADKASACLTALAATGTSFVPVPQPATSSTCQIDTPVRLNSLSTKAGVVKLPDLPTVRCDFALKLSQFVDKRVQPLAQQSVGSAVVTMGTGPGFDCRGRNGDSSAKMSEHAIGDAVDIVYIKFANKTQMLVKDALNVQSTSFAFLRDVRAAACDEFTTVLGPGANKAHAEHFHIDLEARNGGYRLCE